MKKTLLIFGLCAGMTTVCKAQFELGLQIGPSVIYLRGNSAIANVQRPAPGYAATANLLYKISPKISLCANPGFEQKGAGINVPLTDVNGNTIGEAVFRSQFNYLIFPVLGRIYLGKQNHFFINAGGYGAFLTRQTFVDTRSINALPTADNTVNDKRFDFGVSAGLGCNFEVTPRFSFSAELRHNLGLSNVSAVPIINNGTLKTNSANLLLGLSMKIGKSSGN